MAAVDPYSPCPCGSGQKFKWCCHKVEAFAERAQRLFENGQADAALAAIDEGLRKEPDNAWLLTRQAYYRIRLGQPEPAKDALRRVLRKNPKHLGALVLLTRLVLETEGPAPGAAQFQQALTALPEGERPVLASLARVMAVALSETTHYPAALAHLRLIPALTGRQDRPDSSLRLIERAPSVPAWQKNPYTLSPAPEGLAGAARERFDEARRWADQGLWSAAASAFEMLSADRAAAPAADRNLGLCRLWMADDAGGIQALRRAVAKLGTTEEAVDLEALCQQVEPVAADDHVEQVQLIWPLRDREGLLRALRAEPTVDEDGPGPIDPDDPESPEVDHFALLDRPATRQTSGLRIEDIPRVRGRVLVGREIAALEAYDDGRLDTLVEQFTGLAGGAIAPAHPKTKVLATVPRVSVALSWEWRLPDEVDDQERLRLDREQAAWLIRETWTRTPMPYLKGRTPLQAAEAGDAVVPLRAAVFQHELSRELWRDRVDFAALRAQLRIPPEPPVAPETVDLDALHVARLGLVPADRLDDDRLVALYHKAQRFALDEVLERALPVLIDRTQAWEKAELPAFLLYSDMALLAAGRERPAEAFDWVRRGRQADPASQRARNAPLWDMIEVRVRARTEDPTSWVPELAVVLERYGSDPDANEAIMLSLMEMGLMRLVPKPDQPDDFMIDTRPLQMLLAEYGPRVTTATGGLGVSATKPEIWTPGGPSGGGGTGIWTPGSAAAGGGAAGGEDKPKLIIPGR